MTRIFTNTFYGECENQNIDVIESYDYIIINDDLDSSYEKLKAIFISMRSKTQSFILNDVIESWSECSI